MPSAPSAHEPLVSIITPVRHLSDPGLARLRASLQRQSFRAWEHLTPTQGTSEEARTQGILQAQGTLCCFLDADNELPDARWLEVMVAYARDPRVDGAYPARYYYTRHDAALSRYFALLGANDPLAWWLGKADRTGVLDVDPVWSTLQRFTRNLPTLGANGFCIKTRLLRSLRLDPATGFHIDLIEDLRRQNGAVTFWVVAEQPVWHRTGSSFRDYLRRRWTYARTLYFQVRPTRRWHLVAGLGDLLRVAGFAVCSTLVLPQLWHAGRGYRRVRDPAWALHAPVCLALSCVYTAAVAEWLLRRAWSCVRGIVQTAWHAVWRH